MPAAAARGMEYEGRYFQIDIGKKVG